MLPQRPDRPFLERYRGKCCVVFWENGKRRCSSTGTEDEVHARQALADFEKALEAGGRVETVKDVLKRYLISRRRKVQALTRLEEAAIPLTEKLGHFRPDQIDQMLWDDYAANRFRKPNPKSSALQKSTRRVLVLPGTFRREFNVLWAALRLAWKDRFLTRMIVYHIPVF